MFSLLVAWGIAVPVGVYSATHRYKIPDYLITVLQFIGLSVPGFLVALLLMLFAQRVLGQQVGGLFSDQYQNAPWSLAKLGDMLGHLWIPIVVIAFGGTAGLSRIMRANLLDVLNMQYVQTARSKGLKENKVVWKHAVKNAMHPLIMILGGSLPFIISGETVVALVMNIPNVGPMYFNAQLLKEHDKAVADYTDAIGTDPRNGNAYAGRGASYYALGETAKALADFETACSLGSEPGCASLKAVQKAK